MSAAYEQAVAYAMREAHIPRRSSLKQTRARTAARNNRNRSVDFSPDVTASSDSDPQRSSPDDLSEASFQQYNDAVNATVSRYAHHVQNGTAEVVDDKQTAKEFPKETITGRKFQPRNVHIHQEIRVTTSDYSTEPSNRSSMDFEQFAYQEQLQQQQKKLYAQQQQQQKEQQQQLYQQQLQQKLQQQLQLQQEQQRQQQLEEQERLRQQREQELKLRQVQQQREKQLQDQMLLQEHKRKAQQQELERQQLQQQRQQQEQQQRQQQEQQRQLQEQQRRQQQEQQRQLQEQQRRQELSRPSTISVDQLASRNQPQYFAPIHASSNARQSSMKQRAAQNAPRSTVYAVAMPVEPSYDVGKGNGTKGAYQVHPQPLYAPPGKNDINTVSASSGFQLPQYYLANPQSKQETRFQVGKATAKKNGESGSMTCCWILMGGIGLTIALIVIFIAGSQLHIWDGII